MKILVTGATGFLGSHFVTQFAGRGLDLRLLVRNPARAAKFKGKGVQLVQGSLEDDPEVLHQAMIGMDGVIHFAGLIKAGRKEELYRVNVNGTGNLIQAAYKGLAPGSPFLLVSSQAASGPSQAGVQVIETDPPRPVSHYGRSKLQGEEVVRKYAEWLRVSIVRPPVVYGPGDRETFQLFKMAYKGWVPLVGSPDMPLSIIHVEDLVKGIDLVFRSNHDSGSTFFLASPEQPTVDYLLRTIASAYGRIPRYVYPSPWLVNTAARASDFWGWLTGRATMFSSDKLKEIRVDGWQCTSQKAYEELGFQCRIPLEAGIKSTAAWYKMAGWLGKRSEPATPERSEVS